MKSLFNKKALWALPLIAVSLVSCKEDVSELYSANAYDTGDFVSNYYLGRHDFEGKVGDAKSLSLASNVFYAGLNEDAFKDKSSATVGQSIKAMYPSLFAYGGNTLSIDPDWTPDVIDDSDYFGHSFGRTYCLAKTDESFKNGVLSKLYNGQLHCNSWYSKARVQISDKGYDAFFPKTLDSAEYFVISARGGSDSNQFSFTHDIYCDLKVTFYKANGSAFDAFSITMPKVFFKCDGGGVGEATTFAGFKFSDAVGAQYDLSGVCGMGVSFGNLVDTDDQYNAAGITTDPSEKGKIHEALELYEVMLINSKWH
jgi:hypothetical protein